MPVLKKSIVQLLGMWLHVSVYYVVYDTRCILRLSIGLLWLGNGVAGGGGLGWSMHSGSGAADGIGVSVSSFCLESFLMAFSHSGDRSLPPSLLTLTQGGANLMYKASFDVCLSLCPVTSWYVVQRSKFVGLQNGCTKFMLLA